jgi:hypothetical protein
MPLSIRDSAPLRPAEARSARDRDRNQTKIHQMPHWWARLFGSGILVLITVLPNFGHVLRVRQTMKDPSKMWDMKANRLSQEPIYSTSG